MLGFALCFFLGCAPVFSESIIKKSGRISLKEIQQEPEKFVGQIIILGGTIVGVIGGNQLEVVQRPLGFRMEPEVKDQTDGRFLAQFDQTIDDYRFPQGRKITVAAEVVGTSIRALDQVNYVYPVLRVREYHVWPAKVEASFPDLHFSFGFMSNY